MTPDRADRWSDAMRAAALALVDPAGLGGVRLVARHGPVRERWLAGLDRLVPTAAPRRRVAATVDTARLLGGIDFAATLAAGCSVMETGVLASASGGLLVVSMAERLAAEPAAIIAAALDRGTVRIEREGFSTEFGARFVLVALDEGIDDEALPVALSERLAFHVDLEGLPLSACSYCPLDRGIVAEARFALPETELPAGMMEALVQLSGSVRVALHLCRAARASAALRGARLADMEDAVTAIRLVLGLVVTPIQDEREEWRPAAPPPGEVGAATSETLADDAAGEATLREMIVAAAAASLPRGLLEVAASPRLARRQENDGRADAARDGGARGRATRSTPSRPRGETRIDPVATMRAAAPWQRVRRNSDPADAPARAIRVRGEDFRYARRRSKQGTTAVFAVDASGSAAMARLAETKGAIEILLGECYVRRDEVALICFRGHAAQMLLEPTRSLVRAKRLLASLPGGGPTPLAHGIAEATRLAHSLRRRGRDTITVFLTDGRGNVALDGGHGRDRAMTDAADQARRFRSLGLRGVVIDTGQRPQLSVGRLAEELGADYVVLPRGGSERISAELAARMAR